MLVIGQGERAIVLIQLMLAISLENTEKITLEEIGENLANLKAELVRLRKEDEKQKTELQEQKAEVASTRNRRTKKE